MDAATALYASAAVLLVIAGAMKAVRPATTAVLIEDLGLPSLVALGPARLAFGLGIGEIVLGLVALVGEIPAVAVAVGVVYVGFAMTVVRAMAVGAGSCGCFGRVDAPPSWFHVVGNLALAVGSFVAAAGRSPLEVMDDQPAAGAGFVVLVGVLAGVALVVFTSLPAALDARRRPPNASGR